MRYAALVVVCTGVWAQSLQVSPSTTTRGALNSFLIKINSPPGKEPVALQWTLRVADGITITTRDVRAGSAAESADKSITCAATKQDAEKESAFMCIVADGLKPIPNGPVAVVTYTVTNGGTFGSSDDPHRARSGSRLGCEEDRDWRGQWDY